MAGAHHAMRMRTGILDGKGAERLGPAPQRICLPPIALIASGWMRDPSHHASDLALPKPLS